MGILQLETYITIVVGIVVYAIIYYGLSRSHTEHFNGLGKRSTFIDCLYFSTTTRSTSGYGDITPKSNLCKIVVMSQQLITIITITATISLFA